MGRLNINLLGTSFAIQSKEDDEYLNKLLGYYSQIVDSVSGGGLQPLQAAIMSGISLCDELYKEKAKVALSEAHSGKDDAAGDEAERITLELIDTLDKVLNDGGEDLG